MGAEIEEVATIVRGRFNPHIILPPWLTKEGIIEEAQTHSQFAVAGRTVSFQFTIKDFTWKVDYDRLSISSEKVVDTMSVASKVLEKLPHTPVTAIGNNFRYRCHRSAWKGGLPKLGDTEIAKLQEHGDVQEIGWRGVIRIEGELIINTEVIVDLASSIVSIQFNFHRSVKDADNLMGVAKNFDTDRQKTEDLLKSLFGTKA